MGIIVARVAIFLLLFGSLSCFFYLMGKTRVIQKGVKDAYEQLDDFTLEKSRERRQNIGKWEPKGRLEKLIEKPRKKLVYSGLQNRFPGLTIELWLIMMVMISAVAYFLTFFLTGRITYSLLAALFFICVVELIESLLVYKNYKVVGDNLMKFVNILTNYMESSGEITYTLFRVAKHMKEPLRTALEECYNEAQTTGDSYTALISLADKIEHPTFKDIINNIAGTMKYTANFREIIYSSRKIIQEERIDQRERMAMIKKNTMWVVVISIVMILIMWKIQDLMDVDIFYKLFHTSVGRIGLFITLVSYLCFIWKALTINK